MNHAMDSAGAERPSRLLPWAVAALMLALTLITFGMTPYTYLLDEIKVTFMIALGPLLLLAGLALIVRGEAPPPRRLVTLGLTAYGALLAVSALTSRYPGAGWHPWLLFWAAAGFFLAGHCAGTSRRASENFIRFLTLLLLAAALIGFFMYDLTGKQHSLIGFLYQKWGEPNASSNNPWMMLWKTLKFADRQIQSTILNSEFLKHFCLFLLPFPMLLALDPGAGRRRLAWRLAGYAATLLGLAAALAAWGNPLMTVVQIMILAGFIFMMAKGAGGMTRRTLTVFIGVVSCWLILLGSLRPQVFVTGLISQAPDQHFWARYAIIWRGALGIFKDHPILGGGPGTFDMYFPSHRSPDFYLHGVNNVTTMAQNIFLDVLAQTGLFGLAAFLLLLGALIAPAIKLARQTDTDSRTRAFLLAALAALAVMLWGNCFSTVGLWPIGMAPLWSVMGLLAGLSVQAREAQENSTAGEAESPEPRLMPPVTVRRRALAIAALGLIFLPLSVQYGVHYFRCAMQYAQGIRWMGNDITNSQTGNTAFAQEILREAAQALQKAMPNRFIRISSCYKLGSVYNTLSQLESHLAEEARHKGDLEAAGRHEALSDDFLSKAIEAYETLATMSPDYAEVHYNFGIVYHLAAQNRMRDFGRTHKPELKREAEALDRRAGEHLLRMCRISHKPELALMAGRQFLEMGRPGVARDILKAASDREPGNGVMTKSYLDAATQAGDATSAAQARQRLEQPAKTPAQ